MSRITRHPAQKARQEKAFTSVSQTRLAQYLSIKHATRHHATETKSPQPPHTQTLPSAAPPPNTSPHLLLVQRRVPARLGPRHNQPAEGRGSQQRDEDGLQDLDARARGDDAGDDGEEGAANLGEDEDEGQGRGAGVWVEELGGDVDALGWSAVNGECECECECEAYRGEEGPVEEAVQTDRDRGGDDVWDAVHNSVRRSRVSGWETLTAKTPTGTRCTAQYTNKSSAAPQAGTSAPQAAASPASPRR